MIEKLKNDDIINKLGGRFKLTSLMQKRWLELMQGARPMIYTTPGMTELDIVTEEILQDKITIQSPEELETDESESD